ncbi:MAG: hypothetical protein K0V04_08875, partial [Deltaproteobacteria bacterium]|nr:hypothetical protein [Deltaproteobacteria bacterium]
MAAAVQLMRPSTAMGPLPLPPDWLARWRQTPSAERAAMLATAPPGWVPSLRPLLTGPEPEQALVRAEGLPPVLLERPWPPRLSRLLHEGSYVARLCALWPAALEVLADDARPGDPLTELRTAAAKHSLPDALGRVRTCQYLWLAAQETEGAPLELVGRGLSALVEACLQVLLEQQGLADQLVVFGMGKLGGDELNFLSDIDLVFVHDDAIDAGAGKGRSAKVALHDKLRALVRQLEGTGPWRPLFRVDLRLRPFGSRGPLSMSVGATEAYYERHGRAWERQVWLRARPLAGRMDLGQLMLQRLTPFVYRRAVGPEIFSEIADMMHRARREATRVRRDDGSVDVKLDTGGIRAVEFTLQALQLLHGGKNRSVRTTSTLAALDRLLAAGLLSDREHRALGEAYRWLRRVEHRVQLAEGQQTHRVPGPDPARALLARRLGTPDLEQFDATLDDHRERVHTIAQTVAGTEETDDPQREAFAAAVDEGAPRQQRRVALERLGVHDPDQTEARLQHLLTRAEGPFAAGGSARRGAENLLRACIDSADPDAAIARLVDLAASRPAHYGLWRAFAEPSPAGLDMLRLTGELLGASEPLARGLIGFPPGRRAGGRHSTPPDRLLGLLSRASEPSLPSTATLAAELRRQRPDSRGLDATLLHFKHEQLVRVGLHDLGRRPDPLRVGRSLSDVADLVVRMLLRDLAADPRPGPPLRLAVLALGKHGMAAMDYGSDLDLMFVFEPMDPGHIHEAQTRATRLAQGLMSRLESRALGPRLYEVDMRLRPSGRAGLLVTSLGGFRRYHARRVAVWERLAMLRMRPVAEIHMGEPGVVAPELTVHGHEHDEPQVTPPGAYMAAALPGPLGSSVEDAVAQTLGFVPSDDPHPDPTEIRQQTRRLQARIEKELARENRKTGWYNAKTGAGGCLELELLVSALQLIHGPDHPPARGRDITDALTGLCAAGCLEEAEATALC